MDQNYSLSYSAILGNESGDLALGDAVIFEDATGVIRLFPSPEEAVTAWVRGMSSQGIDLVELRRRRGFGLMDSACPHDGKESFLFNVEVSGFGVASTD
jgi:hypothetical protein